MKTLFGRLTELPPAWVCVGKLSHNIFFEVIFRERRVLSNAGGKELRLSNKTKYSFIFAGAVFGGCQNTPNDDNQQKITKKQPPPPSRGSRKDNNKDSSKHSTAMQELLFPDTRQKPSGSRGATENTSKDDIPNIASNCWGRVFINPRFNQQRKRGKKKALKNKDDNFFSAFFKKTNFVFMTAPSQSYSCTFQHILS